MIVKTSFLYNGNFQTSEATCPCRNGTPVCQLWTEIGNGICCPISGIQAGLPRGSSWLTPKSESETSETDSKHGQACWSRTGGAGGVGSSLMANLIRCPISGIQAGLPRGSSWLTPKSESETSETDSKHGQACWSRTGGAGGVGSSLMANRIRCPISGIQAGLPRGSSWLTPKSESETSETDSKHGQACWSRTGGAGGVGSSLMANRIRCPISGIQAGLPRGSSWLTPKSESETSETDSKHGQACWSRTGGAGGVGSSLMATRIRCPISGIQAGLPRGSSWLTPKSESETSETDSKHGQACWSRTGGTGGVGSSLMANRIRCPISGIQAGLPRGSCMLTPKSESETSETDSKHGQACWSRTGGRGRRGVQLDGKPHPLPHLRDTSRPPQRELHVDSQVWVRNLWDWLKAWASLLIPDGGRGRRGVQLDGKPHPLPHLRDTSRPPQRELLVDSQVWVRNLWDWLKAWASLLIPDGGHGRRGVQLDGKPHPLPHLRDTSRPPQRELLVDSQVWVRNLWDWLKAWASLLIPDGGRGRRGVQLDGKPHPLPHLRDTSRPPQRELLVDSQVWVRNLWDWLKAWASLLIPDGGRGRRGVQLDGKPHPLPHLRDTSRPPQRELLVDSQVWVRNLWDWLKAWASLLIPDGRRGVQLDGKPHPLPHLWDTSRPPQRELLVDSQVWVRNLWDWLKARASLLIPDGGQGRRGVQLDGKPHPLPHLRDTSRPPQRELHVDSQVWVRNLWDWLKAWASLLIPDGGAREAWGPAWWQTASAAPSPGYKQASPEGAPCWLPSLSQKPLRLTQSMGKPADPGRGAREAWGPAWWQTASAAPSPGYKQASPEGAPGWLPSLSQKPLRLTQSMGKPADPGRGAREAWGPAWWQTASAAPSPGYKQASPEGAPGWLPSLSQKPLRLTQSMGKPADPGRGAREAWGPAWWQTASAAPSTGYKQASPEGAPGWLPSLSQKPLRLTQSMGKPADPGRGAREAWGPAWWQTASAAPSPGYKQASPEGAPGWLPSLSQKPLRLTQSMGKPADPGREACGPAWWQTASAAPSPGYKQASPEGAPGWLPSLSQKPLRLTQSTGKPADPGRGAGEAWGPAWWQTASAAPSPGYKQASPEGAPCWLPSLSQKPLRLTQSMGKPADPGRGAREAWGPAWWQTASPAPSPGYKQASPEGAPGWLPSLSQKPLRLTQSMGKPADPGRGAREAWGPAWWQPASAAPSPGYKQASPEGAPGWLPSLSQKPLRLTQSMGKPADPGRGAREAWGPAWWQTASAAPSPGYKQASPEGAACWLPSLSQKPLRLTQSMGKPADPGREAWGPAWWQTASAAPSPGYKQASPEGAPGWLPSLSQKPLRLTQSMGKPADPGRGAREAWGPAWWQTASAAPSPGYKQASPEGAACWLPSLSQKPLRLTQSMGKPADPGRGGAGGVGSSLMANRIRCPISGIQAGLPRGSSMLTPKSESETSETDSKHGQACWSRTGGAGGVGSSLMANRIRCPISGIQAGLPRGSSWLTPKSESETSETDSKHGQACWSRTGGTGGVGSSLMANRIRCPISGIQAGLPRGSSWLTPKSESETSETDSKHGQACWSRTGGAGGVGSSLMANRIRCPIYGIQAGLPRGSSWLTPKSESETSETDSKHGQACWSRTGGAGGVGSSLMANRIRCPISGIQAGLPRGSSWLTPKSESETSETDSKHGQACWSRTGGVGSSLMANRIRCPISGIQAGLPRGSSWLTPKSESETSETDSKHGQACWSRTGGRGGVGSSLMATRIRCPISGIQAGLPRGSSMLTPKSESETSETDSKHGQACWSRTGGRGRRGVQLDGKPHPLPHLRDTSRPPQRELLVDSQVWVRNLWDWLKAWASLLIPDGGRGRRGVQLDGKPHPLPHLRDTSRPPQRELLVVWLPSLSQKPLRLTQSTGKPADPGRGGAGGVGSSLMANRIRCPISGIQAGLPRGSSWLTHKSESETSETDSKHGQACWSRTGGTGGVGSNLMANRIRCPISGIQARLPRGSSWLTPMSESETSETDSKHGQACWSWTGGRGRRGVQLDGKLHPLPHLRDTSRPPQRELHVDSQVWVRNLWDWLKAWASLLIPDGGHGRRGVQLDGKPHPLPHLRDTSRLPQRELHVDSQVWVRNLWDWLKAWASLLIPDGGAREAWGPAWWQTASAAPSPGYKQASPEGAPCWLPSLSQKPLRLTQSMGKPADPGRGAREAWGPAWWQTASPAPSPGYKQASPEGAPGWLPSLSQKPLRLTQSMGKPADPGRGAREAWGPAWWQTASAAPSPGYKQASPEGAPGWLPSLSQKPLRLTQSMGKPADPGRGAREAWGPAWCQTASAAPSPGYKQASPEGAPGWLPSLSQKPLRLTQSMGKPADPGRGAREAWGPAWWQTASAAPSPGYKQASPEGAPGWLPSLSQKPLRLTQSMGKPADPGREAWGPAWWQTASAAPSPGYKQASPEGAPGWLPSLSQKPLRLTQSMGKPADPGRGAREAWGPAWWQTASAAPSPGYKQASPEGAACWLPSLSQKPLRLTQSMGKPADPGRGGAGGVGSSLMANRIRCPISGIQAGLPRGSSMLTPKSESETSETDSKHGQACWSRTGGAGGVGSSLMANHIRCPISGIQAWLCDSQVWVRNLWDWLKAWASLLIPDGGAREAWGPAWWQTASAAPSPGYKQASPEGALGWLTSLSQKPLRLTQSMGKPADPGRGAREAWGLTWWQTASAAPSPGYKHASREGAPDWLPCLSQKPLRLTQNMGKPADPGRGGAGGVGSSLMANCIRCPISGIQAGLPRGSSMLTPKSESETSETDSKHGQACWSRMGGVGSGLMANRKSESETSETDSNSRCCHHGYDDVRHDVVYG